MENPVKIGMSGVVSELADKFGKSNGIVLKNFKAPRDDNGVSGSDYSNEVACLELLHARRSELPFDIPQITEHGVHEEMETEYGPYAFIKMTKLENPLGSTNRDDDYYDGISEQDMQQQAYEAGRAAAHLHSLNISPDEQALLERNPLDVIRNLLRSHPEADQFKEEIDGAIELLDNLEGERVFVHNDFHNANMFAQSFTGQVEGVCDFCFSGMGVRELDIRQYVEKYREEFVRGYDEISDFPLDRTNIDIIAEVGQVARKICNAMQEKIALNQGNGINVTGAGTACNNTP